MLCDLGGPAAIRAERLCFSEGYFPDQEATPPGRGGASGFWKEQAGKAEPFRTEGGEAAALNMIIPV